MRAAPLEPHRREVSWSSLRLLPALIWIPLIAALLTSIGFATFSEWSAQRARVSGTKVAKVFERLDALADLDTSVVDIETGLRGYVLTRDPLYLQPFSDALRALPEAKERVRLLTPRNSAAQSRIARLEALVDRNVQRSTLAAKEFAEGRTDEALARLKSGESRELMQSFRTEIAALEALSRAELRSLGDAQLLSASRSRVSLIVLTLLSLFLLFIVARLFAAAEQENRAMEKIVESRTRELSALSTHLQAFAEKEKSELAHNLHDELGGLLTAAKMDLSWIQGRLDQPQFQHRLHQLGSVLDEAMDVKRRVVEDLRPSLLDHFGLPTALRAYFEAACAKAGLQCEVTLTDDENVPKDIAIALFRVVQEGLTNIIRHAKARNVRLELLGEPERYVLRLRDDGSGIDLADPHFRWTHGLTGMRHRVQALGGKFDIESAPNSGTTLHVEVPKRQ